MEKKQFVLNLSIQIEAETEEDALALLGKEEIVASIAKAIASEKNKIQEVEVVQKPTILN